MLEGPPSAGMIVLTAQRRGSFRETFAKAKRTPKHASSTGKRAARRDRLPKPEIDHTRYRSVDELRDHGLQHLRDAVALLEQKVEHDEADAFRRFGRTVADKVANAHHEGDVAVSDAEPAAIEELTAALGRVRRK